MARTCAYVPPWFVMMSHDKFPHWLFVDYPDLKPAPMLLYMIMLDKLKTHGQIDEDGNTFTYLSVKEMRHVLHTNTTASLKAFRKLEEIGLARRVVGGPDIPARIYLLRTE